MLHSVRMQKVMIHSSWIWSSLRLSDSVSKLGSTSTGNRFLVLGRTHLLGSVYAIYLRNYRLASGYC